MATRVVEWRAVGFDISCAFHVLKSEKMSRVSITFNPEDLHMLENRDSSYSEDKRRRAERRWKRWELISNEGSEHNCFPTRITVKSCGNMTFLMDNKGHIVEDEIDEEYKMFVDNYCSIGAESNNNDDVSNNDVDTIYRSDNDYDSDPQYKIFLENLKKEGKSYISSVIMDNELFDIRYEGEEEEEEEEEEENNEGQTSDAVESQQILETERRPFRKRTGSDVSRVPMNNDVDEDYQIFLNLCKINGNDLVYGVGSELKGRISNVRNNAEVSDHAFDNPKVQGDVDKEEQTGYLVESHQSLETEREPCNKRPQVDVSSASMKNCNTGLVFDSYDEDYQQFLDSYRIDEEDLMFVRVESDLKGKGLSVAHNSRDQAFDTPNLQYVDEDYREFLNSMIIDEDMVHATDRNIAKTYKGDCDSDSPDPDLILLEPNQIGENTPFIFSRIYDSSCFDHGTNPKESRLFFSNDDSEFRRRLMKDLERPYNQEEYDTFRCEVHNQRKKQRHAETRQGVVKSYLTHGVNKSYLELYPDLAETIDKFKEPHKVLFLLRGFFFWLQNVTHDKTFRPWTDESCLDILQKM